MATPVPEKLRVFYPSKTLSADGGTLAQRTADAGGLVDKIVDSALTEADDYWKGAIGWFDGDTATAALRGQYFHVKEFDADHDALILARPLPAVPAAGDTFRLVLGGNYRSSMEVPGMKAAGALPEFTPLGLSVITGVTIKRISPMCALGNGQIQLKYFSDSTELHMIVVDGGLGWGDRVDLSGDPTDLVLSWGDGLAYIVVDVDTSALPASGTGDHLEAVNLAMPTGILTPDYETYETRNEEGGLIRHRLEVAKNTDPSDTMADVVAYTGKPAGDATAVAAGESLGTSEGSFDVGDATDWPTRSFWIKNKTANSGAGDCRFVSSRSGTTLSCQAVKWATLGFDAGETAIQRGDAITGVFSGATAVVEQVKVTSGTWAGNDAAGELLLKNVSGTFTNDEDLQVSAATVAVADGGSTLGLRGYTAVSWAAGDTIELMGDIDIAHEDPAADQFESPADEHTPPDGLTFQDAANYMEGLVCGHLGPGEITGIWRREWINDPHGAREGVNADVYYAWG